MAFLMVYSSIEKELSALKEISRKYIAYLSEEKWEYATFRNLNEVKAYLEEKNPILDLVYADVTQAEAIPVIEVIRKKNTSAIILLIADATISPLVYMKPSIMAASLLLRPFDQIMLEGTVKELLETFIEKDKDNTEEVFIVDNRDEKIRIPYNRICYFEAREKKIYLCLEDKEYSFYDTMGNLEKELPEYFVRCHRSFIINNKKLVKVYLSQNEIELEDEIFVPFSRSYRDVVKEMRG